MFLVGCAATHKYGVEQGRKLNSQQATKRLSWHLQGRLLIKSDEAFTANIHWQHKGQSDTLKLFGTLGLGAVLIELDKKGITLDQGKGRREFSRDTDAFIAQKIGFVVPLTALREWVVGAHLKGSDVVYTPNGFIQMGWHISYSEYIDTPIGVMPRKVKIHKDNIKLKLIVDAWGNW